MTMVNAFLRFNSAVVGGAIENLGTMRIFHSEVGINNADNGGAIANIGGSLHISRTTVSSNSTNGGHGGGFYLDGGDVSLTDSIVTGNKALGSKGQGGGAYVLNGALKVSHSVFIANKGMGAGGGIANLNGDANIINSTFGPTTPK
jgi:fibronectin-binding autotransporter adhesin